MTADFIIMLIGERSDPRRVALADELDGRTQDALRASGERLNFIDQHAPAALAVKVPRVAVVFCRENMSNAEIDAIKICRDCGIPIIPVVKDLTTFTQVAPKEVGKFNGFQLADAQDVAELAGLMLELLGLQRAKRKIFISYARLDGSAMAQQLRDAFTARWYSVFLDTGSIRPGEVFQENLKQELADSDVVVLLNSPAAPGRPYVEEEVTFATQARVGGVQVVWPGHDRLREGALFMPVFLENKHIASDGEGGKSLTPEAELEVLRRVADLRTALQQQREEQLLRTIEVYARSKGFEAVPYLGRHIELRQRRGDKRVRLYVALGVPTSRDLERSFKLGDPRPPKGRLVYNRIGITDQQSAHLNFFGAELNLDLLDPKETLQWTVLS
jgi:TIR domain